MNLTDSEVLKFLKGSPVLIDDICAIYPATLGEIIDLGYDTFQQYLAFITMTKPTLTAKDDPELKALIEDLTDFQYMLLLVTTDVQANQIMRAAFRFFCHDEVFFSIEPTQIIVGPIEEQHVLNEGKFYDLQQMIRWMYFLDEYTDEIIIYEDDPPPVKKLKMKMRINRERTRKAKAKEAEKHKSDMKFSDLVGSMAVNDCGLNIVSIMDVTYYAFHDQLKRMGWRDQFNINQKAALAGAKIDKSQLKHWMRSIANQDK